MKDGCWDCVRDLVGTRVLDSACDITLTKPALVNRAISNQLLPLCIVAYKSYTKFGGIHGTTTVKIDSIKSILT